MDYLDARLSTPGASSSRSSSPDSSVTTNASFIRASNTIDDLTRALASFSRGNSVGAPDVPTMTVCCCGREDCQAALSWGHERAKLEKDLELSAEIGQALLQRHEAYVRRQDNLTTENERTRTRNQARIDSLQDANNTLVSKMADLIRESSQTEKRMAQAEVNLEIADSSNRTLLKELQETRSNATRLTARNALLVGVETNIAQLMQERDDLIQEKNAEALRAKNAESKLVSAELRASEMQGANKGLEEELASARTYREDFSEVLLRDARARLEGLQDSLGVGSGEDPEVHKILESLVADNEAIKRDNAELQNLLTEAREDLRIAREELQEQPMSTNAHTPTPPSHMAELCLPNPKRTSVQPYTHDRKASVATVSSGWMMPPGSALVNMKGHKYHESWTGTPVGTPTHQTAFPRQAPSPFFAPQASGTPWPQRTSGESRHQRSSSIDAHSDGHLNIAGDRSPGGFSIASLERTASSGDQSEEPPWSPSQTEPSPSKPRTRPRPLMILSRSKGVQTDVSWMGTNDPFAKSSTHPHPNAPPPSSLLPTLQGLRSPGSSSLSGSGGTRTPPLQKSTNSDSSSLDFSKQTQTHQQLKVDPSFSSDPLPALIDRASVLQTRVSQADIHTLTTRLKRQNIVGGDVGHLSKSTLKAIVGDINGLRVTFKAALDAAIAPTDGNDEEQPNSILTRKDLRALLKLLKDMLTELTQLQAVVNEVTLDPSKAAHLQDRAASGTDIRDRVTAAGSNDDRGRSKGLAAPGAMGWLTAPIQKLFNAAPSPVEAPGGDARGPQRGRSEHKTIRAPRPAPKLAPAISATTTTVNVEFGPTGTRRAEATDDMAEYTGGGGREGRAGMTSIGSSGSLGRSTASRLGMIHTASSTSDVNQSPGTRNQSLLGIFAGAPQPSSSVPRRDPWIVLPKGADGRRTSSGQVISGSHHPHHPAMLRVASDNNGPGLQGQRQMAMGPGMRATSGYNPHRLSLIVDAVIDDDAVSIAPSERNRTLRSTRNLSDSSMHTTYIRANPVNRLLTPSSVALSAPTTDEASPASAVGSYIDRESVLQTLSRKVSGMRSGGTTANAPTAYATSSAASETVVGQSTPPTPSAASSPPKPIPGRSIRGAARSTSRSGRSPSSAGGGMRNFIPGMSWINTELGGGESGGGSGSLKNDSPMSKTRRDRRGDMEYS